MVTMTSSDPTSVKAREKLERSWTDSLLSLEIDEAGEYIDTLTWEIIDKLHQWESTKPCAKFFVPRKKKSQSLNEKPNSPKRGLSPDTYQSTFLSCVEPTTYRYVPGNGKYRAAKISHKLEIERPLKRAVIIDKPMSDHNVTPKEFHRRLKQELEKCLKEENDKKKEENDATCRSKKAVHAKDTKSEKPVFKKDTAPLPPISVPLVNGYTSEHKEYFNSRLVAMEHELKRDVAVRHTITGTPDGSTSSVALRSRSVPPVVSSSHEIVGVNRNRPLSPWKISPYADITRNENVIKEIVEQSGMLRIAKPEKNYSKDDIELVCSQPVSRKPDSQCKGCKTNRSEKGEKGYHSAQSSPSHEVSSVPSTHHVRYTTAQGNVVSIPKFGRFVDNSTTVSQSVEDSVSNQSEKEKVVKKSANTKKSTVNTAVKFTVENPVKDALNAIITTTHYVPTDAFHSDRTKISRHAKGLPGDNNNSRVITNSFHAVPVGRSRRERDRADSAVSKQRNLPLPELAGRSVATTSNRFL